LDSDLGKGGLDQGGQKKKRHLQVWSICAARNANRQRQGEEVGEV